MTEDVEGERRVPAEEPPIRQEQVQNAVGFLSHPKVRASSEASKRSFLVGKGLTEAEIQEAFRRVPQGGLKEDEGPSSAPGASTGDQVGLPPAVGPLTQRTLEPSHKGYSWTNVLLGMGFAAAAAYSIKSIFGPSIAKGYAAWKSSGKGDETRAIEDDSESESELVQAVREQTELMRKSLESLQILIESQNTASSHQAMTELTEEVRHLANRLEGRSGLADSSVADSAKHPVSYMEVLEMLEKGETPPGIRDDIDDKPPEPDMSPPVSKLQPVPKPWHDQGSGSSLSISVSNNNADDTEGDTPSRRDLSGERPGSILTSAMTPPEKSPSVVMEKRYTKTPSDGFEGSGLGRPTSSAWRPPPLPTPLSFENDDD